MAEATSKRSELGPELSPGQRAMRFAVGVLFYLILLIPRVRRLRRRVALWNVIRAGAILGGAILLWFYFRTHGLVFIAGSVLLASAGLLLRATPIIKSLDERARELGAIAVLNGGTLLWPPESTPRHVNLFAGAAQLTIEDASGKGLLMIPISQIQSCRAQANEPGEGMPWELEITWGGPGGGTARFQYRGFFAEHLARVAESTIENLRRKDLPVLR